MEMNYRQRMALQTKEHILKVSLQLFRENGYNNVSVSDIVSAAQVSRGCFYSYFKNKDDLLFQGQFYDDDKYQAFYTKLITEETTKHLDPLKQLELFLLEVTNIMIVENGLELTRMYYSYSLKNPVALVREDRFYFKIIKQLLEKATEQNLLSTELSIDQMVMMALTINRGLAIESCLKDDNNWTDDKKAYIRWFCKKIAKDNL